VVLCVLVYDVVWGSGRTSPSHRLMVPRGHRWSWISWELAELWYMIGRAFYVSLRIEEVLWLG
jgi:hypothetical protein